MGERDTGGVTRRVFVAGSLGSVVVGLGAIALGARGIERVAAAGSRRTIDRLTVHHTATPTSVGGRPVDASLIAESHRRRGLGLGTGDERDCAYHFVVLPEGDVLPGRPLEYWGSGTRSGEDNLHAIGVALVGDFSAAAGRKAGQDGPAGPTPAQLDALESLALWALAEYGFDPGAVHGHREVSPTECPGALCDLDGIRARLAAAHAAGRAGIRPPGPRGDKA